MVALTQKRYDMALRLGLGWWKSGYFVPKTHFQSQFTINHSQFSSP